MPSEIEECDWMVVCRWRGGRSNKPPRGEVFYLTGVSRIDALAEASIMQSRLPAGCSTTYRAIPMPDYLKK